MKRRALFAALVITVAVPLARAASFPDAHEPPPPGWTGPVFKLSQNYPATPPPAGTYPWKSIDPAKEPEKYIKTVLTYALEGNVATDWRGYDNPTRKWFHAPWMHYGNSGREFIRGMTRERNSRPKELAPTQPCYWQNWAVGFYNAEGGYVVGQVWRDPKNPDAAKADFPDGTVSIKLLFTAAPEKEVPYLKNGFRWQGNLDPLTGACTTVDPPGKRTPADVTLLQVDIAVRDSRVDATTGWVMGTFVYDGNATGATPWDRLVPVGVQWGNDPALTPAAYAAGTRTTESWINPALAIPQHLGWLGRLNGPIDNPQSACLSCHGTGQDPEVSGMIPPKTATDAEKMRWFRNVQSGVAFDAGSPQNPKSLDYSLQLSFGIQNLRTAAKEITPAIANGDVVMMMTGKKSGIVFPVSRDEGVDETVSKNATVGTAPTTATASGAPAVGVAATRTNWLAIALAALLGFAIGVGLMMLRRR
jgi:hypothetical protein